MSRNAQGGSTKYQTIVFPKTECSGTSGIPQQIPFPFPSPPFSRSYVIPAGPWHSENSWVKYKPVKNMHIHTLISLGRTVSTWHRTSRGFPFSVIQEEQNSHVGELEMFWLQGTGSTPFPFIVSKWTQEIK